MSLLEDYQQYDSLPVVESWWMDQKGGTRLALRGFKTGIMERLRYHQINQSIDYIMVDLLT